MRWQRIVSITEIVLSGGRETGTSSSRQSTIIAFGFELTDPNRVPRESVSRCEPHVYPARDYAAPADGHGYPGRVDPRLGPSLRAFDGRRAERTVGNILCQGRWSYRLAGSESARFFLPAVFLHPHSRLCIEAGLTERARVSLQPLLFRRSADLCGLDAA